MKLQTVTFSLLILVGAAVRARGADEAFDPQKLADTITPYVDETTIFVGRLDVTKVDVEGAFKLRSGFVKPTPENPSPLPLIQPAVTAWKSSFTQAGGRDIYLVMTLGNPQYPGYFVVPVRAGANAKGITSLLKQSILKAPDFKSQQIGDVLVFASEQQFEVIKSSEHPARPALVEAFRAAGDGAVQALVAPSNDQRRVLAETLPNLPEPFDDVTGEQIVDGIQWLSAGVDVSMKPQIRFVLQSANAEGAKAMHDLANRSVKFLGEQMELHGEGTPFSDPAKRAELLKILAPEVSGDRVVLTVGDNAEEVELVASVIAQPIMAAKSSADASRAKNSLRQVGLAMHNYHDAYGHFPAASVSKDGKPLLSWRVLVLPYLDQGVLFKKFKLDEPWDSPHNKALLAEMPEVYQTAGVAGPGLTTIQVPVSEGALFSENKERAIRDMTDGTSNTIMTVQTEPKQAVPWTKPEDFSVDAEKPTKGLAAPGETTFVVGFADGSVQRIEVSVNATTLLNMFTFNKGDVVSRP